MQAEIHGKRGGGRVRVRVEGDSCMGVSRTDLL